MEAQEAEEKVKETAILPLLLSLAIGRPTIGLFPMPKKRAITLGTVLEHMQHMQRVLMEAIGALDKRVGRLETKMDGLETRMIRLETRVDRMEVNLTDQIDAIDKRLDAIEIETLPKRVKKLEVAMHV
ncbi:TPA: hypothetical protein DCL30_03070 [Candidatus Peribacteria bacterium]|nr:hypothetical protein [Candidatus Peribacteria bacterium]